MQSPTASSPATVRVDALPALLAAAAAACLVTQFALPPPNDGAQAAVEHRVRPPQIAPAPAPAPAPLDLSVVIATRAIFTPEGRSGTTEGGATAAAPTLLGVAQSPGADSAVVRDAAGVSHALKLGEHLGPWRLTRVSQAEVGFTGPTGALTLHLGAASSATPTVPFGPAPSPPAPSGRP